MIKIITDSSCDLPDELIKKYEIRTVPLSVEIEGVRYTERIDITPEQFWEKMKRARSLPKTSQPSPALFAEVFKKVTKEGHVPLCITISSKLSGTYQSAMLGNELVGKKAVVFDSLAGSLAHGIQVLMAARLATAGKKMKEIFEALEKYRESVKIIIPLDTLENIIKGGRLNRVQGTVAKLLNIKVILHGVKGEVKMLKKVRGKKRFREAILKIINGLNPEPGRIFGITHVNNIEDANYFKEILEKQFNSEVIVNGMGPTFATYAGPGGLILAL
ncbi:MULTISPECIES: DegV family protein [Kosmotoga]|uniref:DegV family protein n=1 Tax=Kosmotoga olearia (strain ATCC BAA-1733 / DSM 21960 / TBF 19.5.1) TaxID=521045 RepID=C5CG95_KOSOT|nr:MULTISPECIES: DegV family protein [Kosmotoga]ACR79536.1 degV family protein [Kosmotoga olearia TBF 19.5.1]OAA22092.1 fatty acid-binding protein DegV [Kosmotoga sp. DU53]